eukprot:4493353-Pleurochrysis_carterae.AAC.1
MSANSRKVYQVEKVLNKVGKTETSPKTAAVSGEITAVCNRMVGKTNSNGWHKDSGRQKNKLLAKFLRYCLHACCHHTRQNSILLLA